MSSLHESPVKNKLTTLYVNEGSFNTWYGTRQAWWVVIRWLLSRHFPYVRCLNLKTIVFAFKLFSTFYSLWLIFSGDSNVKDNSSEVESRSNHILDTCQLDKKPIPVQIQSHWSSQFGSIQQQSVHLNVGKYDSINSFPFSHMPVRLLRLIR